MKTEAGDDIRDGHPGLRGHAGRDPAHPRRRTHAAGERDRGRRPPVGLPGQRPRGGLGRGGRVGAGRPRRDPLRPAPGRERRPAPRGVLVRPLPPSPRVGGAAALGSVAGDYRAADGWIRLHTNAPHHRDAALAVLGTPPEREAVAAAVRQWSADDLEGAVVAAGGCAAAMRSAEAWALTRRARRWLTSPGRVGGGRGRAGRSRGGAGGQAPGGIAGPRPHAGAGRPRRDPLPRRVRRDGVAPRPAGLGRARRAAGHDAGQGLRPARPEGARRAGAVRGTAGVGGRAGPRLPAGRAHPGSGSTRPPAPACGRAWSMSPSTPMAGPARGGNGAASTAWSR